MDRTEHLRRPLLEGKRVAEAPGMNFSF